MEMRIIVASDGKPAAVGALRVARALVERGGAPVEVVCAVPPFPVPPSRVGGPAVLGMDGWDRAACEAARERVRAQLQAIDPMMAGWPITVEIGAPAMTIVRHARDGSASLIVMGLGRHALADRWLGTETALRVMRLAHVPVLAVPSEATSLPDRAVAAVDFTSFSRDAATTALKLLPAGGVLHLAYVFWRPSEEIPWVGGRDWVELQRERIQAELSELAQRLDGADGVRVEPHVLEGDPATETLRFAERSGAGLVAAGSQGTGFLSRLLMGSVSTRLVRGATSMVLIAPPRTLPAESEGALEGQKSVAGTALHTALPAQGVDQAARVVDVV
jgi:nucleotide-binding universal stress UspA family protein